MHQRDNIVDKNITSENVGVIDTLYQLNVHFPCSFLLQNSGFSLFLNYFPPPVSCFSFIYSFVLHFRLLSFVWLLLFFPPFNLCSFSILHFSFLSFFPSLFLFSPSFFLFSLFLLLYKSLIPHSTPYNFTSIHFIKV